MKNKGVLFMFLLIVTASSWWFLSASSGGPKEGVLDVWTTWAVDATELEGLLGEYEDAGGLPVRVRTGVEEKRLWKAMAGSTPPDLVILSSAAPAASLAEEGLVHPLDRWIGGDVDDFYPACLAPCQADEGATLCVPWGCDVDALFWNKDLFRAAGLDPERPPQTMEELVEYADRLTLRDGEGRISQAGFIPDLNGSRLDLFLHASGAGRTEPGAALAPNDPAIVEAINWQRGFYDRYGAQEVAAWAASLNRYSESTHPLYAGKRASCQQCHRTPPSASERLPDHGFYTGKVAMMIGGQWQVGSRYARLWGEADVGIAPLPPLADHPERANLTVVRGPVALIPAGARDLDAAAALLWWMVRPETMADAAHAYALLPARRSAAEDPRFRATDLAPFLDGLDGPRAAPAPTSRYSAALNQALEEVERQALHGGADPAPLLDQVQAELGEGTKP